MNRHRRLPLLTVAVAGLAAAVFLTPEGARWFACTLPDLASGQVWRLWTCHLVHWSFEHFVWDVGTLFLLGSICEIVDRRTYAVLLAGASPVIALSVAAAHPDLVHGGLSGLDVACFCLALAAVVRAAWNRRDRIVLGCGVLLAAGLAAKIAYEVVVGSAVFVRAAPSAFVVVPLAHLVGALIAAGLAVGRGGASDVGDGVIHPI